MPDVAEGRVLSPEDGRQFPTQVAGLFLVLPLRLDLDLPQAGTPAGRPGSEPIPPLPTLLALPVPKLLGKRRVSHSSDLGEDEDAGRCPGLNVLPKGTSATDSSSKTERTRTERRGAAASAKTPWGDPPRSFHRDFHAIPGRDAEPDLENPGVPTRNRAGPAVMAFVTQAAGRRVLGEAPANVLRAEADALVPKFAEYGKEQPGRSPARWLFDSRVTTSAGLSPRTQRQVGFITIRRRGSSMVAGVSRLPADRGRCCQITQAKGKRRQVAYVDAGIQLDGSEGAVRQRIVTGLGHESPTFFLTNDRPQPQSESCRESPW